MAWQHYYTLLSKYHGDLSLASDRELDLARAKNQSDPMGALFRARLMYRRDNGIKSGEPTNKNNSPKEVIWNV